MADLPTISFASAVEWEAWLDRNHSSAGVWMKIAKKASGIESVTHPEAVEVALCHGWIDSHGQRIDEERWALRFAPRRPRSNWSDLNRARARRLLSEGRMTAAGIAVLPADL